MSVARRVLALSTLTLIVACRGRGPSTARSGPVDSPLASSCASPPPAAPSVSSAEAPSPAGAPAPSSSATAATVFHRTPPAGARSAAQCNVNVDCGPCMHDGCGWCGGDSVCTAGDTRGPYEGSCSGRWTVAADCTTSKHELAVMDAAATRRLVELVGTLTAEGARVEGKLEARVTTRFELKRGRCYVAGFRIAPDARPDPEVAALPKLGVPYVEGGEVEQLGMLRSALRRTCPQKDGTLEVRFASRRDPSRRDVGTGAYSIELFSGPISDGELRAQLERKKSEDDDRLARAFCAACARDLLRCQLRGDAGCIAGHQACLRLNRLSLASCEAGRFDRPEPPRKPPTRNPDGTVDL